MFGKPKLVTLPDGRQLEERRQRRKVSDIISQEPLAAIAFGTMIAIIAGGVIFSSVRDAKSSDRADKQSQIAADNAKSAEENARAARDLAATIDSAVKLLTSVGAASRKSTFDSHQAMQDTLICILTIPPADRVDNPGRVRECIKPLTPPPDATGAPATTTTTGGHP